AWPSPNAWDSLALIGPMARTVDDCAFLLSAMAGPDPRAPVSIAEPGEIFSKSLKRDFKKVRVAWSRDLGGLPMDDRVTAVLSARKKVFKDLGCVLEEAEPDFSGATEAFETLRALGFLQRFGVHLTNYLDWMKSCYYITITSQPAISVPAGFTPDNLPVGLQIVGRYRDDFGVLQLAHAFEQATQFRKRRPALAA